MKALILQKDKRIECLSQNISEIDSVKPKNKIQNEDDETVNSNYTNVCQYCWGKFKKNSLLKEHIINHSGPNILHAKRFESEESDWETDDE